MSYTFFGKNSIYSNGSMSGSPSITPDFAKCPKCKVLFFQKDLKVLEEKKNSNFAEHLEKPDHYDLVNALKTGIPRDWKEEKEIREALWNAYPPNRWDWPEIPDCEEYLNWLENCKALIPLMKKTLKNIKEEEERFSQQIMIAELYRNIGSFDKCMEAINELPVSYKWLSDQFSWQCKIKNTVTFELIKKHVIELSKNKEATGEDYYFRGNEHSWQKNFKKALADYKTAETKGFENGITGSFYEMRADALREIKEYDKAIDDYTKAIKLNKKDKEGALLGRSIALKHIGEYKKALSDINAVIIMENHSLYRYDYHAVKKDIFEAAGDTKAALYENFKYEYLKFANKIIIKDFIPKETPSFYSTESEFKITAVNEQIIINMKKKDGDVIEPEILYSGGKNALLRRNLYQFILLENIPQKFRKILTADVLIKEPTKEYQVKVRQVTEKLNSLDEIIKDGYPFLTSIRAKLYIDRKKPISKVIDKEDLSTLICILAREEDYEQLERYAAEGLPLNEHSPDWFRKYEPTPIFYTTSCKVLPILKDLEKMVKWLVAHGADPNKIVDNITAVGNQCYSNGSYSALKALLENGADPNLSLVPPPMEHFSPPPFGGFVPMPEPMKCTPELVAVGLCLNPL